MNHRKTFYCLLLFFILVNKSDAQWLWGAVGQGDGEGLAVAVDEQGNAYNAGSSTGVLIVGKDTMRNISYDGSAYLMKCSPGGKPLWTIEMGSPSSACYSVGTAIAADKLGNVYFAGSFEDTLVAGMDTLITPSVFGQYGNLFLAKLNSNGKLLWVKQAHASSYLSGILFNAMTVDKNGYLYATGSYTDTVSLGKDTLIMPSFTGEDVILVKFDTNGNTMWIRTNSGHEGGKANDVITDINGNVYITGYGGYHMIFGTDTIKQIGNCFLIKYDSIGNVSWANGVGDNGSQGMGVVTDNNFNVYVGGIFSHLLIIGKDTVASAYQAPFLAKFNFSGSGLWARGGSSLDSNNWLATGVVIDSVANVYLGGEDNSLDLVNSHNFKIAFGPLVLMGTDSSDDGISYIVKYDSAGNPLCGTVLNGAADDENNIAANRMGKYIYLGDDWGGGNHIFKDDTLISNSGDQPFIARWNSCNTDITESVPKILADKIEVTVFPNPSYGVFNFQLGNKTQKIGVEVYNVLGKKVYNASINISGNEDYKIDLSDQPIGMYLYRLFNEKSNLIVSGKLIIQE